MVEIRFRRLTLPAVELPQTRGVRSSQLRMHNHESSSSDRRGEQQHEKKLHNDKHQGSLIAGGLEGWLHEKFVTIRRFLVSLSLLPTWFDW
ncbi:unnamed protein product [Linum tenue]|uniref:Uncharacterized protein n=1 Tax=Linum tenue TaxID=586396 RepID=A0AAV0MYG0_9ROSI|nr:unnamed protein product [Linum tenue]